MKKRMILSTFLLMGAMSFAQTLTPDFTPAQSGKHIVINLPQQRMFVYEEGGLKNVYPIAIGKARTTTPPGEYSIGAVGLNPTGISLDQFKESAQQLVSLPLKRYRQAPIIL